MVLFVVEWDASYTKDGGFNLTMTNFATSSIPRIYKAMISPRNHPYLKFGGRLKNRGSLF